MFTTSDRENLTGEYVKRNILPYETFGQRVVSAVIHLSLFAGALATAFELIQHFMK